MLRTHVDNSSVNFPQKEQWDMLPEILRTFRKNLAVIERSITIINMNSSLFKDNHIQETNNCITFNSVFAVVAMGMPRSKTDDQIFSKSLTKTDVGVRLSFPMEAMNVFEFRRDEDKVEFDVTDGMGNTWKFGLSKRNEARHSHPKPVLSSGWRAYVQAKGLKMDDRVTLYRIKGKLVTKTRFKVRAQRKVVREIKLFGEVIHCEASWVDVERL